MMPEYQIDVIGRNSVTLRLEAPAAIDAAIDAMERILGDDEQVFSVTVRPVLKEVA
ncbi:MAG: hypothetical protein KGL35_05935 [Bradyrhizobium sp.]|nr:hypothetical protein [Bradyrhizobium sp.]